MTAHRVIDRVGDLGAKLLPWGVIGLMGASALGGSVSESVERLVQQNGAVLLLVALVIQYAPRAIDAQRAQAAALAAMAAAVENATKDSDRKLEELLVGQQLILDRMEQHERRMQ